MASSPIHAATFTAEERAGLTSEQAAALIEQWGYNELPRIEIPLWWVFVRQFTGTMPYMLELACILAAVVHDWLDFGIILLMLVCNGCLGFFEELKAAASLAELTNQMEQSISTIRDGAGAPLVTRFLVPGDVVLLVGGCALPADIEWLEGDVLAVDTAALTGEPLPRKYPSDDYGKLILCGCTVSAGEAYGIVRKTGVHTEIGSTNADIMKDKTEVKVSVFEQKVLFCVKIIILLSLLDVVIIFLQQGFAHSDFHQGRIKSLILTCLSIIIASVPVALPLVLQVTMALGAGRMATDFSAIITSFPALQDISSMTTLCSDKTGTLTTAKITIHAESVYTCNNFTKEDVALYAGLASSRDKKEDAIDRSVINHFDRVFGPSGLTKAAEFTKVRNVGFNPIYKRVLFEYTHPKLGRVTIGKGASNKVLDTSDHGVDDAADQWKVENLETLRDQVLKVDYDFSKAGYKTLGIVVKINDGPFKFVGILPMLDPPRHDTAQTVKNLVNAGIDVKMITGDHLNIAKETARLIGMGVNMYTGEDTRGGSAVTAELIKNADGFASVLPRDKREVVLVLRDKYREVVGMTGDGVNDAPALSAAQCGIAVDDATDAAKNAAAIILTSPGLSAIYSGVVESRRIFRKLKAYITYRFAATIQIVLVLTILIFAFQCTISSLYVILLALFNDLTMLPIAYDYQQASSKPENPDVGKMLIVSTCLGIAETILTLFFAVYLITPDSNLFHGDYTVFGDGCSIYHGTSNLNAEDGNPTQGIIFLQMFLAAEILIFSTRAPSYFWYSILPSPALVLSVTIGCVIISIFASSIPMFGGGNVDSIKCHNDDTDSTFPCSGVGISSGDVAITWAYNIFGLFIVDVIKVELFKLFKENMITLPDEKIVIKNEKHGPHRDIEAKGGGVVDSLMEIETDRQSAYAGRLSAWADKNDTGSMRASARMSKSRPSMNYKEVTERERQTFSGVRRISLTHNPVVNEDGLRPSFTGGTFKPNTPANKAIRKYV